MVWASLLFSFWLIEMTDQEKGTNDDTAPITAYITSGDVDIVDGDHSIFIKRYIPDMKDQQGAVNVQFIT